MTSLHSIPSNGERYVILLPIIIPVAISIPLLLLFFGLSALFGLNGTSFPTFFDQDTTLFFDLSFQFYLVQLFPLYCQPRFHCCEHTRVVPLLVCTDRPIGVVDKMSWIRRVGGGQSTSSVFMSRLLFPFVRRHNVVLVVICRRVHVLFGRRVLSPLVFHSTTRTTALSSARVIFSIIASRRERCPTSTPPRIRSMITRAERAALNLQRCQGKSCLADSQRLVLHVFSISLALPDARLFVLVSFNVS
mmetsp:Transcript_957/g.2220  ORF Transcript_957/g.2220 Transcript_957/m.2220 type:complete len:247 (+) Transcript_957:1046-1786(+)